MHTGPEHSGVMARSFKGRHSNVSEKVQTLHSAESEKHAPIYVIPHVWLRPVETPDE